jgi:hypothetical protein
MSPIATSGDETAATDDAGLAQSTADLDMSAEMAVDEEQTPAESAESMAEAAVEKAISAEQRRALLADPFVESLLESTLENTFFNMMSEAVHGEFNLHTAPRLIIQNVHAGAEEEQPPAAALAPVPDDEPVEVPAGLLRSQSGIHQSDAVKQQEEAAAMESMEEEVPQPEE